MKNVSAIYEEIAKALIAPKVRIKYTDRSGNTTERDIVITEVSGGLITALDVSSEGSKWHMRSFRCDGIQSMSHNS